MEQLNPLLLSLAAQLRTSAANMEGIATTIEQIAALPAEPAEPAPVEPDPVEPNPVDPEPVDPDPVEPDPVVPIWDQIKQSRISIPNEIQVPAGQRDIYIPISVDHTDRGSFYCYVDRMVNVSGGGINVGGSGTQRDLFAGMDEVYRWSPGDDLTHYVKLTTKNTYRDGQAVQAAIRVKGLGDGQKGKGVTIRFVDGAQHPDMPDQFHRPLRRLNLSNAKRKNSFKPSDVQFSDSGFDANGKPVWRSRLSHGYSQAGNGETGAYLNAEKFPRAETPHSYDAAEKAFRLHTVAFPDGDPVIADGRVFPHQAAVIQGQTMDEVCGFEGVWRMEAKIPIRRYSWPAFWLIGRGSQGAKGSWTQWPPEIDVLEKFNHAWGAADTPFTTTFAQHYGNAGSNSRKGSFGNEIEVNQWLGAGPLNEGYHSWACAVTYDPKDTAKSEVTFFFDDVEVGCQVLHARHQDMRTKLELFPIANVAVRAPGSYTAEQYNTDAGRGNSGDMLIRDIGYWTDGFTF